MKKYITLSFALCLILIIGCNYDTVSTISFLSDTPIKSVFPIGNDLVRQPDSNYNPNQITTLIEEAQSNQDTERLIEFRRLMAYHFYHNTNNIDTVKTLLDDLAEFCISRDDTLNFLLVQNDIIETFLEQTNHIDVRKTTADAIIRYANKDKHTNMLAEGYRNLGLYHFAKGDDNEPINQYYHRALNLFKNTKNKEKQTVTYQNLTETATPDSMSFYAFKAWSIAKEIGSDYEVSKAIDGISRYYKNLRVNDKANILAYTALAKELIENQSKTTTRDKKLLSDLINRLGIFNENRLVGLSYSKDASKLQEELGYVYGLNLSHNNLCKLYSLHDRNYHRSIEHGLESLRIAKQRKDTLMIIESIYYLYGNFSILEEYEKAIDLAKRSYDIAQLIDKSSYRRSIAYLAASTGLTYAYFAPGQLDKSIEVSKECLNNQDLSIPLDDLDAFGNTYFYLGLAHMYKLKPDTAEVYFQKVAEKYSGKGYRWNYIVGNLQAGKGEYRKALEQYQIGLSVLDSSVSPDSLDSQPQFRTIRSLQNLFYTLNEKSEVSQKLYEETNEEKYMLLAENTIENALEIFYDLLANKEKSFKTKSVQREITSNVFLRAFMIANQKYDGADRDNRLFEIIEKFKGSRLKIGLEMYSPDSWFSVYNENEFIEKQFLESEINIIEGLSKKEKTNDFYLDSIITFYRPIIERKLEKRISEFEIMPNIGEKRDTFSLKYTIKDLQNSLNPNMAFVNYMIGDHDICVQIVKKNEVHNIIIPKPKLSEFKGYSVSTLTQLCEETKKYISVPDSLEKLDAHLSQLYDLIFKEIEEKYLDENINLLIVSGDGVLKEIPFGALVINKKDEPKRSEYLIEKYAISTAESAEVWIEQTRSENGGNQKILVTAPPFSKKGIPQKKEEKIQITQLSGMDSLRTNEPVADSIKQRFRGTRTLKGKKATKKNLLKHVEDYDILLFSTHGKVNTPKPDSSHLALIHIEGKEEAIYARDIHKLNIAADLAVLGACGTGSGASYRGEGVISLGRAFNAAGAKSLVYSLWKIPEETTSPIILEFMSELEQGANKAEALHNAKLKYLNGELKFIVGKYQGQNLTFYHPYFWSGIVISGDISSLDYLSQ